MAVTASAVKKYIDGKIAELWEESADLKFLDTTNSDAMKHVDEKIELFQEMREKLFGDRLESTAKEAEDEDEDEEEEDEPRKRYRKH